MGGSCVCVPVLGCSSRHSVSGDHRACNNFCEEKLASCKGNQTSQDTREKSSSHLETLEKDWLKVTGEAFVITSFLTAVTGCLPHGNFSSWKFLASSELSTSLVKLSSEIPLLSFSDKLPWCNYFYVKSYCYMQLNCPTTQLLTIMMILTKLKVIQLLALTSFPEYLYLFQSCVDLCQAMLLPER